MKAILSSLRKLPSLWKEQAPYREYSEEEVRTIGVKFDRSVGMLEESTNILAEGDYFMIGRFVQVYCVLDLCARRLIEDLRFLEGIVDDFSAKLTDTDVVSHLARAADALPLEQRYKEDIAKISRTAQMHRKYRNIFAHWAGRRIDEHDIFVFLTSKANEAKKYYAIDLEVGSSSYAIFPIHFVDKELRKLEKNCHVLGLITDMLEQRFPKIIQARQTTQPPSPLTAS